MTGQRKDMTVDLAFSDAIKRDDREALSTILKSDADLSRGEQLMLNDYIAGNYERGPGNHSGPTLSPIEQRRLIANYLKRTSVVRGQSESIVIEICDDEKISRATFHAWLAEANISIKSMQSQGFSRHEAIAKFIDIAHCNIIR